MSAEGLPVAETPPRNLQSGVRKYARYSLRHALRRAWVTRGAVVGEGVYVEPNVQLQRHPERIRLGAYVMLKEGARLCPTNPGSRIEIGDWTTVGAHTFVYASAGISIGNNCLIAPFCYFVDSDHGFAAGKLIREQTMTAEPIRVEDDVWLGTGVVITRGVTVHRGAVIGARAVVMEDVPENAVAVGNPARVVKYRE
jgi:acetyltransferase-like isoleucine patch superfamily enzyme